MMLTCKEMTEVVTEFLEGRMPFLRRMKFQLHLGMCRHCRRYLAQTKLVARTLGRLPAEPIPRDIEAELLRRFENWKR